MFIQAASTFRIQREEDVMKTGVLGALVALTAFFALIGGWPAAFSAEPKRKQMVLAAAQTQIAPVALSIGTDTSSLSDTELPASGRWPFEIISILILGIMMQLAGWGLRAHRRHQRAKSGKLNEMLNGGVSV
jgi:hypothetical protein